MANKTKKKYISLKNVRMLINVLTKLEAKKKNK